MTDDSRFPLAGARRKRLAPAAAGARRKLLCCKVIDLSEFTGRNLVVRERRTEPCEKVPAEITQACRRHIMPMTGEDLLPAHRAPQQHVTIRFCNTIMHLEALVVYHFLLNPVPQVVNASLIAREQSSYQMREEL